MNNEPKIFIAILPPDAIQTEVIQIQNYFRDRYTNNKAETKSPPHITLIAPFNLSSDRLESLQIELEKFAKTRSHQVSALIPFPTAPTLSISQPPPFRLLSIALHLS